MSKYSRFPNIVLVAVIVVLLVVMAFGVAALVSGPATDDPGEPADDQAAATPVSWQTNPEVEQALLATGFACLRQTYGSLNFGDEETETALIEKMVAAGIAEAELELCIVGDSAPFVVGGLPEDIKGLHEIYSDFRCETGIQIPTLETSAFLVVGGIYYAGNQDSDTEVLRGILDEAGIDYTEDQFSLRDCTNQS